MKHDPLMNKSAMQAALSGVIARAGKLRKRDITLFLKIVCDEYLCEGKTFAYGMDAKLGTEAREGTGHFKPASYNEENIKSLARLRAVL